MSSIAGARSIATLPRAAAHPRRPGRLYPPAAHPLGVPGHAVRHGGAGRGAEIGGFLGVLAGVFVLLVIAVNVAGEIMTPGTALPTPALTLPSISP